MDDEGRRKHCAHTQQPTIGAEHFKALPPTLGERIDGEGVLSQINYEASESIDKDKLAEELKIGTLCQKESVMRLCKS